MSESASGLTVQPELPIANAPSGQPSAPRKFVIPDDPVVDKKPVAPAAPVAAEAAPKGDQNIAEQAPAPVSDGEKPNEEVTPEQAAKREGRRFERKLDKAYRERAEARARAEFLEKQLAEFSARTPAAAPAEGEPTLAQFDYDPEKYAAAKAEFASKQAEKKLTEKQQQESQKQARERLLSSWEEKVDRAADKYEDFSTVVGELQPNSPFVAALMEADNGEDVAYYLGKHPKEAQRIAALPPLTQVREIGKLEAKLLLEPKKPIAPSKAPAPVTPVAATTTPNNAELSEKDSMDVWMKKRQKQLAARR